ncbi:MAG: DUF6916 family protein [Spirulinaceae cyanobacterium]
MNLSRRTLFLGMGTAVGTIALPTLFAESARAQLPKTAAGAIDLNQIHAHSFDPYLNQTFQVSDAGGQQHSLKLVKVHQLAQDAKTEQFSLIFKAPATVGLSQATYTLEHRRLGQLKLFIVPVTNPEQKASYYEAAFGHLKPGVTA